MGLSLGELARRLGAELRGDANCEVFAVATLEGAKLGDVSFFSNRRYKTQLQSTSASAVILAPSDAPACPVATLTLDNPYLGYARAVSLLSTPSKTPEGIHETAAIADGVSVAPSASIGPQAVLESGVVVGEGAVIGPGCVVGRDSRVGPASMLVANVSIGHRVSIGARVLIHPGVGSGPMGSGSPTTMAYGRRFPSSVGCRSGMTSRSARIPRSTAAPWMTLSSKTGSSSTIRSKSHTTFELVQIPLSPDVSP